MAHCAAQRSDQKAALECCQVTGIAVSAIHKLPEKQGHQEPETCMCQCHDARDINAFPAA